MPAEFIIAVEEAIPANREAVLRISDAEPLATLGGAERWEERGDCMMAVQLKVVEPAPAEDLERSHGGFYEGRWTSEGTLHFRCDFGGTPAVVAAGVINTRGADGRDDCAGMARTLLHRFRIESDG